MPCTNESIYRILDANINRAVEGIRVLEESARMILDDAVLTGCIKEIRHSLIRTVKSDKQLTRYLLPSRGSERDVLRNGETARERNRSDVLSVIEANAGRVQEALRSLEEYGKLVCPSLTVRFKAIRFSLYDIEKKLAERWNTQRLINRERLSFVIVLGYANDGGDTGDLAKVCIDAGAGTIAFNDPVSPDREFITLAEKVSEAAAGNDVTTLVCDRLDCAIIAGFDGVLLGSSGIPPGACRRLAGPDFIAGCMSVFGDDWTPELYENAHFLIAEVLDTAKLTDDIIRRVTAAPIPVIARGNFTPAEAEKLVHSGFEGIAVDSGICSIQELRALAKAVKEVEGGTGCGDPI